MTIDQSSQSQAAPTMDPLVDLDRFLSRFSDLSIEVSKGMLSQSIDADEKEVISSYAKPLTEQIVQLGDYIRTIARGSSRQVIEEVGTILKLTAADTLIDSGMRVAGNLSSQSARIGISDIIKLIKKIILKLFDIFSIPTPRWLAPLLDLIDEIVDFLVATGVIKLSRILSTRHQDYMAELTQMKRLQRAIILADKEDSEEDDD